MGWVYLLVALAVTGAGAYGVHAYNSAIESAEKAKATAAEFARAYDQLSIGVGKLQQAANVANSLAERRNGRAIEAEKGRDQARRELDELKEKHNDVKAWADAPVPSAVRLSLDGAGSPDNPANLPAPANRSSSPDAKP